MMDGQMGKDLVTFIKENTRHSDLYWYPLNCLTMNVSVIAFNLDQIYKDNKIEKLEEIAQKCGITKVVAFQMDYLKKIYEEDFIELLYEKDERGYNFPWYVETFYYDETKEWMIYVSHEGTITYTGSKIVSIAEEIIPSRYCTKKG